MEAPTTNDARQILGQLSLLLDQAVAIRTHLNQRMPASVSVHLTTFNRNGQPIGVIADNAHKLCLSLESAIGMLERGEREV